MRKLGSVSGINEKCSRCRDFGVSWYGRVLVLCVNKFYKT